MLLKTEIKYRISQVNCIHKTLIHTLFLVLTNVIVFAAFQMIYLNFFVIEFIVKLNAI